MKLDWADGGYTFNYTKGSWRGRQFESNPRYPGAPFRLESPQAEGLD